MKLNSSWATNETHAELWLEQSINAGMHIGSMAFGVHVVVFFTTLYYILRARRVQKWCLIYVCALFLTGLLYIASEIKADERAWIDYRNYPGGPLAWLEQRENDPPNLVAEGAVLVVAALAEALLLYRCWAVWTHGWLVVIFPSLIYVASLILGCLFADQLARPGGSLWADATVDFSRPYLVTTLSFNVIASTLLVARLLYVRRYVVQSIGPEYGRVYTSAAAIVMESALPFAVYSFVVVVLYGLQNTASNVLIPALVQLEAVAAEMIILRVARGRAWSRTTGSEVLSTSIAFHNSGTERSTTGFGSSLAVQSRMVTKVNKASSVGPDDASTQSGEKMKFAPTDVV